MDRKLKSQLSKYASEISSIDGKEEYRELARETRRLAGIQPDESACQYFCSSLSFILNRLDISHEKAAGGVYLGEGDLLPHSWIIAEGPYLVDGTIWQFQSGRQNFEDVAVLEPGRKWSKYYGMRGKSNFDIPNDQRKDLKIL